MVGGERAEVGWRFPLSPRLCAYERRAGSSASREITPCVSVSRPGYSPEASTNKRCVYEAKLARLLARSLSTVAEGFLLLVHFNSLSSSSYFN